MFAGNRKSQQMTQTNDNIGRSQYKCTVKYNEKEIASKTFIISVIG